MNESLPFCQNPQKSRNFFSLCSLLVVAFLHCFFLILLKCVCWAPVRMFFFVGKKCQLFETYTMLHNENVMKKNYGGSKKNLPLFSSREVCISGGSQTNLHAICIFAVFFPIAQLKWFISSFFHHWPLAPAAGLSARLAWVSCLTVCFVCGCLGGWAGGAWACRRPPPRRRPTRSPRRGPSSP